MKRHHLVGIAGVGLIVVFVVGAMMYRSHKAEKTAKLAKSPESPLLRHDRQSLGADSAKVHLVEFMDPGCETCRAFHPFVKNLLKTHDGKLKLTIRYVPLHMGSDIMVQILEASRKQDKYWETLQVMFDSQPYWASHHHPQPDQIWQFLPSVGLDIDRLKQDMTDPAIIALLQQDVADAKALGVRKTPSFFVNGQPLTSFGYKQLASLVDAEIAKVY